MTDAPSQTPPPPVEEAAPTPGQAIVKALAIYIFPLILLGLLIAVIVGVVRLGLKSAEPEAPLLSEIPAASAPANPAPVTQVPPLQNRLDDLQAAQSSDGNASTIAAAPAPSLSALSAFSQRLDRLEAAQARTTEAAELTHNAVRLERAAQGSAPFRNELNVVERGLNEPALLLPLRPLADRGVPSLLDLSQSFASAAARAHSAAQHRSQADDPLGWLGQWLGTLVTIRRTDLSEGADTTAVLNRAEARLKAGDLSGAVRELEALPPQALSVIRPWLDQARERIMVDDTTRAITELSLSRLASQGDDQ